MPSFEVCAECKSLLLEVIHAVNAYSAELRILSAIAHNGPHPQFAEVRKCVEEASNAVSEAIELYKGHVREHTAKDRTVSVTLAVRAS